MSDLLQALQERHPDRVRAVLNILVETPYFYRADDEDTFFFLRRHRAEFAAFYQEYYGWTLVMDEKCARVFKGQWYNEKVTEPYRDAFGFRHRDDCIAFMILLEFFERQLDENALTVEDPENLRFRYGDLLIYTQRRFRELFPGEAGGRYTEEFVRATVLRRLLPILERYRLVERVPPPADVTGIGVEDTIYEAMPALYHYNTARLSQSVLAETPASTLWPGPAAAGVGRDDGETAETDHESATDPPVESGAG
jgi:hypothetical protein